MGAVSTGRGANMAPKRAKTTGPDVSRADGWHQPCDPYPQGWRKAVNQRGALRNLAAGRYARWRDDQPDDRQWAPRDGYVTPTPDVAWQSAPWNDATDGYDAQPSTVTAPAPVAVAEPVAERADDMCPGCGEENDTVADALCRGCQARAVMRGAQLARVIATPDTPADDLAAARAELVRLGVLVPDSWDVAA